MTDFDAAARSCARYRQASGERGAVLDFDATMAAFSEALRSAANDAIERAAKIADGRVVICRANGAPGDKLSRAHEAERIAATIRSLKVPPR